MGRVRPGQRALEQRAPRLVDGHAAQLAEEAPRRAQVADALEVLDRLEQQRLVRVGVGAGVGLGLGLGLRLRLGLGLGLG